MITPSPTDLDSIRRDSSQYSLVFETSTNSMPTTFDIAEATDVTRKFLEDFMFTEFARTTLSNLDDFVTRRVTSSYNRGNPIVVELTSTARFDPDSSIFPMDVQIDESLAMAFADGSSSLGTYISRLQALPSDNVFSSTTSVTFSLGSTLNVLTPTTKKSKSANGAGIAAGAVAATLLAAGLVIYKRRADQKQEEGKGSKKADGAATVAGDTYTGETVSITASSLDYGGNRYRDEETGQIHHLEAIRETYDDSSVTPAVHPAWDEGSMDGEDQAYTQVNISNEDVSQTEGTVESSEENNSQGQHNDTCSTGDDSTDDDSTMSGGTVSSSSRSDAEDRSASYRDPYLDATHNGVNSFEGIEPSASSDIPSQMDDGQGSLTAHGAKSVGGAERPLQAENASRNIEEGEEGADDASHGDGSSEGQFVSTNSTKKSRPTSSAEIGSLLAYDLDYLQEIEQDSEEQDESQDIFLKKGDEVSSLRPRTVSEIESLLSADLDDESQYTESSFNDGVVPADDCSTPSQRPRTVSEIECLLSADLDDDVQMV
jgi:hypothetical protein